MQALESCIDELYKGTFESFVAARNSLAKTLAGDAAKRVKALVKPTAVAWSVNQVVWRARPAYERLMSAGKALRTAQIAALNGRAADLQAPVAAHRKAITEAAALALRFSGRESPSGCGHHPRDVRGDLAGQPAAG